MPAVLPIVSVAATVVGAGVSFFAQRAAAAQAQTMANYNYQLATQQAQMQAAIAEGQASANAKMYEYQAAVQARNAEQLQMQARSVLKNFGLAGDTAQQSAAVNAERDRENARRFLALQTAKVAGSGLQLAGTPLDSLADAAGTLELKSQEIYRGGQIEARKLNDQGESNAYSLRNESTNQTLASSMSLFAASNARWEGEAAASSMKLNLYGAEIEKMKGYNDAAGYKMASYGTLFSGLANLGTNIRQMNYYGA